MQKTEAATKRASSVDDDGDIVNGMKDNLAECQEILAVNMRSTAVLGSKGDVDKCIDLQNK